MVAFPLLFAFITVILDTLRARKPLIKTSFLLGGAAFPAGGIFLMENGREEVVGGWSKVAGIEVGIGGGVNAPLIAGELILFITVAFYSLSYFDFREKKTPKVLAVLLLMHAGLLGGAFLARDFFNFYIYMEIASVSAFALVAFSGGEKGAKRAAFKYLILSLLASYLFIFALGLVYMETGGYLNVKLVAGTALPGRELNAALGGIALTALIMKAGVFPLHFWLPDAHSKAPPTPVSAMLSGAVVNAPPAYGMMLLFSALPVGESLKTAALTVATASIFFGVVMMLLQAEAKRFLAYSTVSQMGYVLLGIGTLNFTGGAAYYALAHSLAKGGASS